MRMTKHVAVGAILALGTVTAVLAVAASAADTKATATSIRVGISPDPAYAPYLVAKEKGFFSKYGIDATIRQFSSGADMNDAVVAGELDYSASGGGTLLPRLATKREAILAVSATSGTTFTMAAHKNLVVPRDFIGKKLGVVRGTTPEYVWKLFLQKNKIDPKSVTMVYASPPELAASLAQGRIDALYLWQPWPFKATELSSDVRIYQRSEDIGYKLYFSIAGNTDYIRKNPGTTVNVLRALRDAIQYINANRDETVALMAKTMRLSEAETRPLVADYVYKLETPSNAMMTDLRETAKWLASIRRLNSRIFPWKTAVLPAYVQRALRT